MRLEPVIRNRTRARARARPLKSVVNPNHLGTHEFRCPKTVRCTDGISVAHGIFGTVSDENDAAVFD